MRASRALLWHFSKIDHPFHRSLGQVGFGFRGVQTVFQLQAGHVGHWRKVSFWLTVLYVLIDIKEKCSSPA